MYRLDCLQHSLASDKRAWFSLHSSNLSCAADLEQSPGKHPAPWAAHRSTGLSENAGRATTVFQVTELHNKKHSMTQYFVRGGKKKAHLNKCRFWLTPLGKLWCLNSPNAVDKSSLGKGSYLECSVLLCRAARKGALSYNNWSWPHLVH